MATPVEIERAKIKQMTRIEKKLEALKDAIDMLLEKASLPPVEEPKLKPKKVKSEK